MSYKINNALFWAYFPITVFSFLLPFYCVSLGFTPLQTTSLSAVFSLVLFFGKIISGKLCDSLGRKKIFLTGLVLCAAAYVILLFPKIWFPFTVRRLFAGWRFLCFLYPLILCYATTPRPECSRLHGKPFRRH